ncbi:MAG TPA: glycosyltransferase family 4 protein [Thermomicrobiales bacterium]|nr:glycosyltransferase family 4 protein [Thermomicrobiales bacterium]
MRSETMNPLRILMVAPTSFFADYGCHVRILEEARALTERGHMVRVCTYHNGSDVAGVEIRRSVDIPWLKRAEVGSSRHKAYLDVALCVETARQALAFRPDVIHGHLHEGALIGSVVARLLRKPLVFDYQGSLTEEMLDHGFIRQRGKRERVFRFLERRIDRLPDAIVPSGIAAERHLIRSGVDEAKVNLILDGVNTHRFDPARLRGSRAVVRERLGIPVHAPVVVYLGLLAEYQGTSLLIDAARELLRRRTDVYVVIAGYPGADAYAAKAAGMPVSGRVLFPGRVPYEDAPELLTAGDVAVAPKQSLTESNGKLFNYMAMGLPVVAIDNDTNRAILGELGHLVAPDPGELASGIERALADGDCERSALRQRIVENFNWDDRVIDLECVYSSVVERRRSSGKRARSTTTRAAKS